MAVHGHMMPGLLDRSDPWLYGLEQGTIPHLAVAGTELSAAHGGWTIHTQNFHFIQRRLLFHYMTRHFVPFTFTAELLFGNIWNALGLRAADHKLPMRLEVDRFLVHHSSDLTFDWWHHIAHLFLWASCQLSLCLSGFCLHIQEHDH